MSALLGWFLSNPTILAILAGFVGGIIAYFKGTLTGARKERDRRAAERLDSIKDKKEIEDEVADLGPADLDVRFKRWLQDNR